MSVSAGMVAVSNAVEVTEMDDAKFQAIIDTPFTRLGIKCQAGKLSAIDFVSRTTPLKRPESDEVVEVVCQLERYFDSPKWQFDLPLVLEGTPFQRSVWHAMQQIPAGETRSYGQIAALLKSSPRAVGNACRANPCPVVVPCHRIIAAHGLGGFAGQRDGDKLAIKRGLLTYEGAL
ncbi:MAG: methylated-DNA--[protein]-cysteine S-methyltransferase [Candidatus Polarisedimenticolaceae bacterium]|nr:methylated-DNA--[protein]-cysteine S-methyltransferase [Candidatus Polarisedimenticolaceae bacterium]